MLIYNNRVLFNGFRTTPEEREALHKAGFVHITGLITERPVGSPASCVGQWVQDSDLGTCPTYEGKRVVVTLGGEIWLHTSGMPDDALLGRFCPNGKEVSFALSGLMKLSERDLNARLADPNHDFVYVRKQPIC